MAVQKILYSRFFMPGRGLFGGGYQDADAPAGGVSEVIVPALDGVVGGVDLGQGGGVIALGGGGVLEQDLHVLRQGVLLAAGQGGKGGQVRDGD